MNALAQIIGGLVLVILGWMACNNAAVTSCAEDMARQAQADKQRRQFVCDHVCGGQHGTVSDLSQKFTRHICTCADGTQSEVF